MKNLIDGDIITYRCAASAENDPVEVAILRCANEMENLLSLEGVSSNQVYLSGESNFRFDIFPEYKANRTQPKPRWLQDCREFLVTDYGARVTEGYEADDALGIEATWLRDSPFKDDTYIISSDDKDLLQLAGSHYNIRTQKYLEVSPEEATWMFYYQLLVGDTADNVKGCKGIGKVKANRALEVGMSEWDLFEVCRNLYSNDEEMLMNGQLLWILRKEGGIWQFPTQGTVDLENEFGESEGAGFAEMGAGQAA